MAVGVLVVAFFLFGADVVNMFNSASSVNSADETPTVVSQRLVYEDRIVGTGAEARVGSWVTVHYVGVFDTGQKFDSSLDRGEPISFRLGVGEVIKGWDEGLTGMKVGGRRILVVPPELGYGSSGFGPIPGNSTLIFEVELLSVQ